MKTVLITGASKGIGKALAVYFAKQQFRLVLVARTSHLLESLKSSLSEFSPSVLIYPSDLTEKKSVNNLIDLLHRENVQVDWLINNAGFGDYGLFVDSDPKKIEEIMLLNIVALTNLTRLLIEDLQKSEDAKVINIASTAAFMPGPLMSVYFATKAYVLSFSEAIRFELKKEGISVTTICPGPTQTEFQHEAGADHVTFFSGAHVMRADQVAEITYQAAVKKKGVVICGLMNKLLICLVKIFPRSWVIAVVNKIQSFRDHE